MNLTAIKVAILAVCFGAGWAANGWRLDARIKSINADHANAVTDANERVRVAQADLQTERDRKTDQVAVIDVEQTVQLRKAQNETDRLRTCVANGTCGLRVNVVGPANCPANVPITDATSSVDHGAGARLAPDAEQAYWGLRVGMMRAQAKLTACQQTLNVWTNLTKQEEK